MNRDYADGETRSDVVYFIGTEVEHTPMLSVKTLFVVGVQPAEEVINRAMIAHCDHVYLGANQSYYVSEHNEWEELGIALLDKALWVTLDFPVCDYEGTYESCGQLFERSQFIPQISVRIPYIEQSNYNTVIKIDDKGYDASNPGVWCHQLHDLMDRNKFTPWHRYEDDEPVE